MPDHPYYRGARAADSSVGEHGGLPEWATQYNVDLEALVHLATQRAMRGIATHFLGIDPAEMNLPLDHPGMAVNLPPEYMALLPLLSAMFIDGWSARHHLEDPTGV